MEACLLCLEVNNDMLDGIKSESTSWQELNIEEVIEKHFWPLNVLPSSWICLTCWKEVRDFHKFYLRIEEAHTNAGKVIKIKKEIQTYGYLEPEILIDQPTPSGDVAIKTESPLDEPGLDYVPFKQRNKHSIPESNLAEDDPLEKSVECDDSNKILIEENVKANSSADDKLIEKNLRISFEPDSSNEYRDSVSTSTDYDMDNKLRDGDSSEDVLQVKRTRTYIKRNKNYKNNDIFIMEHFKQMHCDLCQAQFEDFPDMQKHYLDIHKQIGYLVCCGRKFYHRYRLVDHIQAHLNPDHFKCNECGKVLSDRVKLKNHLISVHRPNDVELKHPCDICGKSFTKYYVLRTHKLTHLPEEEKKFPCIDCGKLYGSAYLLKIHREVMHLNKLAKICYICGLTLRTSTEYKAHMNKHEGIAANLNCDICGLRLTSERGLKVHKESQHPAGGKQEHCCPICPRVSPTLRALKKHINTMHEKGFEHKCNLCEKAFKRAEALKEHIASHTGTPLYTCPWCPKTFNSNSNMHAHRKKMHPKEWREAKLQKYAGKECFNMGNISN